MSTSDSILKANIAKYDRHFDHIERLTNKLKSQYKVSLTEIIYISSFILNFLLGKIIHVTSQNEEIYNYYNNKKNFINQIFVKKGWGWTTFVILFFYGALIYKGQHVLVATKDQKLRLLRQGAIRYFLVTGWWILFTQWCFGLPLMDKIYIFTGGKCAGINGSKLAKIFPTLSSKLVASVSGDDGTFESTAITSYACKKVGGSWVGGHDPSGHVFLLVHSSLYLFTESRQYWISWENFRLRLSKLINDLNGTKKVSLLIDFLLENPHIGIMWICSLWWFMLLMTNIYFHSLAEKLVGLAFGYFGIAVIYYVPQWI